MLEGSLNDRAMLRHTAGEDDYRILPWANMVKIGGQSIIDRGRAAVYPLIDEIVANLPEHKMILGTGAGTARATSTALPSSLDCRRAC